MMNDEPYDITDLPQKELLRVVGMFLGDVLVHYGMWFTETVHKLGPEQALEREHEVLGAYVLHLARRLAPHFGIEMDGDIPKVLMEKSREELLLLVADIAKIWVTGDGLWFQAVERTAGMVEAKKVNDTCWSHFAHMEAFKIRSHLQVGPKGGLKALEQALKLRIYSSINAHSVSWENENSLLFAMTECRVQAARRRKGLDDYPCRSAGIVEYTEFAQMIDPRVKTECVSCPPERIPDTDFCSWRFIIGEE